ncbi:MAG TPA: hypothetical protein VN495_01175 [Candidatus Paceibacterota bacterium]|nr:hypothetical protein [Candidatus Paceibacterota bacterium]
MDQIAIGQIESGGVVFVRKEECSLLCKCGASMRHARTAQTALGTRHTFECPRCDLYAFLYTDPLFCIRSDELPTGKSVGEYAAERAQQIADNDERALHLS